MRKKTAIIVISLLAAVAVGAMALTIKTVAEARDRDRYIAANYRHAFEELVAGVSDLDSALKKSVLVTTPSMAGTVLTEVFGKAQTADMALGVLPFSATELEKTAAFINKAGDYALALSRKAAGGETFTEEERQGLRALSETASKLSARLNAMQQSLGSAVGSARQYQRSLKSFDEREGEIVPDTVGDQMSLSETEFPEIPALIYDGPFSEHLLDVAPRAIEGMEEIDQNQGRRIAAQFLGLRAEQVFPTAQVGGALPSFAYSAQLDGIPVAITLSKQGGVVYSVLNSRMVESRALTPEQALEAAREHLQRRGYKDMKESYYMVQGNVLTANFAYVQEGVTCYADLIKVGVAMDDGSLQSFEAADYLTAHTWRELPAIAVDAEAGKSAIPADVTLLGTETVLIPSSGKYELLCHEYECEDASGQRVLIYVNAATGRQEKILLLLSDENGTLTI